MTGGVRAAIRDAVVVRVDDAFDAAARAGFGVCVGVLLLGAIVAAVALSPERVLGDIQLEPGGDAAA